MSEFENLGAGNALQPFRSSRDLIVVETLAETASAAEPPSAPARRLSLSRFHFAAAAALAVVAAVATALFVEDREQARTLAEQASENASLVHTIKSMKVRLDAIDSTMSNAGLTDLRQSVGEIRTNLASTREVSGALAQLSQRVDKLDHEASAKVDKLAERVDHEASALTTGLSTRIDKLEQKIIAPLPTPVPIAQAKQPPARPKFDNVSMDKTSSIERPKPLLRGYVVLDASDDVALIGGRFGEREVRQGDFLPGAGRVERIELGGNGWVVMTSGGLIASADIPRY
jgi:hypothetical protein